MYQKSAKVPLKVMNVEIQRFPIYILNSQGKLIKTDRIKDTGDYNHMAVHLHHYIPFRTYYEKIGWFTEHGIEQKLILVTIPMHEQIHEMAVHNLTDREFRRRYKISRKDLIFGYKEIPELMDDGLELVG